MPFSFTGSPSVASRTIYTNSGPVVKRPINFTSGYNLYILNPTDIKLPSVFLDSTYIDKFIKITGSPGGVNDGDFRIARVLNPQICRLEGACFSTSDDSSILNSLLLVVQELQSAYKNHAPDPSVHRVPDLSNGVSAPRPLDLPGAIIALNELRLRFNTHISLWNPTSLAVHRGFDSDLIVRSAEATDLNSAVLLANELQRKYKTHSLSFEFHQKSDTVNRIYRNPVDTHTYGGDKLGPLPYTIYVKNAGMVADSPADVTVRVNYLEAGVDYVEGLSGAVVLTDKPNSGDNVTVDYLYTKNFPSKNFTLNSFGYLLNSAGNRSVSGMPDHLYPASTVMVDPESYGSVGNYRSISTYGYKYKAFDRPYTAGLNDAGSLILNSPLNKLNYGYDLSPTSTVYLSWDAKYLPNTMVDPWQLSNSGTIYLDPDLYFLYLYDNSNAQGLSNVGPFFQKSVAFNDGVVANMAFRFNISNFNLNENSTQVGFGFTDGARLCQVSCLQGPVTNLSTALATLNDLLDSFNKHLVFNKVHSPNDVLNKVDLNDAYDLASALVISKSLKAAFNKHISLGPVTIHRLVDTGLTVTTSDPTDLPGLISLVNDLRDKFNQHIIQTDIHYANNPEVTVSLSKQVGILTNRGFSNLASSYNSGYHNWSIESTYRLYKDASGNVFLYISGDSSPLASVDYSDLPLASSAEFAINEGSSVFWGVLGSGATSESLWRLIRISVVPLVYLNKLKAISLSTNFSVLPEQQNPAWINVGYGGDEYTYYGLMLDSCVKSNTGLEYGKLNGAYKGYLRLEPFLSTRTTLDVTFEVQSVFHTHSIDNRAFTFLTRDNDATINLCFIQPNPVPATITGSIQEPFTIVANDNFSFIVNDSDSINGQVGTTCTTAAQIAAVINAASGLSYPVATASGGKLTISSVQAGNSSSVTILGGTLFQKIGISNQKVFGKDSSPDPSLSYSCENLPDLEPFPWKVSGTPFTTLVDRKLQISKSNGLYTTYYMNDWVVLGTVITPTSDWKLNYSLDIKDVISGSVIQTGPDYRYGGIYVSLNEGSGGKNIEMYLVVDNNGVYYWMLCTLNAFTGNTIYKTLHVTNLGQQSITLSTDKFNDLLMIFVDGALVTSTSYSSLESGFGLPAVAFGSGAKPLVNAPLDSGSSYVSWSSFAVFRDSYVDPAAAAGASQRRAVAIYTGGDVSALSSYTYYNVDWTQVHKYRLIKDPTTGVSLFLDDSSIPIMSVPIERLEYNFDSIDMFNSISADHPYVSFGHFGVQSCNRSRWISLGYSIGKLLQDHGITYNRPALNTANTLTSVEHLQTQLEHIHGSNNLSSSETPTKEFQFSSNLLPTEQYNSGQVPFSKTWNLNSYRDITRTITPIKSILSANLSSQSGYIGSFISDYRNMVVGPNISLSAPSLVESELVIRVNILVSNYLLHIADVASHTSADLINIGVVTCSDLTTAITSIESIRDSLNPHMVDSSVHIHSDNTQFVSFDPITDLKGAIDAYNACVMAFDLHISGSTIHVSNDDSNVFPSITVPITPTWADVVNIANITKAVFNAHYSNSLSHVIPDQNYMVFDGLYSIDNSIFDVPSILKYVNGIADDWFRHTVENRSGSHLVVDLYNFVTPSATDINSSLSVLSNLYDAYNEHRSTLTSAFSNRSYHKVGSPTLTVGALSSDFMGVIIDGTIELKSRFIAHIEYRDSHKEVFPVHLSWPVWDGSELSVCSTLNYLKEVFNSHIIGVDAHINADLVNNVVSPDASDWNSAATLAGEIQSKYNSHLVLNEVHNSVVIIKVEKDSDKILSSLEYQINESGEENRLSVFSDERIA